MLDPPSQFVRKKSPSEDKLNVFLVTLLDLSSENGSRPSQVLSFNLMMLLKARMFSSPRLHNLQCKAQYKNHWRRPSYPVWSLVSRIAVMGEEWTAQTQSSSPLCRSVIPIFPSCPPWMRTLPLWLN